MDETSAKFFREINASKMHVIALFWYTILITIFSGQGKEISFENSAK